jgi:ankyrin repeat protein
MFEYYRNAANGNLDYIKKLLLSNPGALNKGWDGSGQIFTQNEQSLFGGPFVGLVAGAVVMNPVFGLALLGIECLALIKYMDTYVSKHLGWTLLEFAAEKGQTAVAAYLILAGADTNNKFIIIAKENGYGNFVTLCTRAIEIKAKRRYLKNVIDELNSNIDELTSGRTSELISNEAELLKVKAALLEAQENFTNLFKAINCEEVDSEEESTIVYPNQLFFTPPKKSLRKTDEDKDIYDDFYSNVSTPQY